MKSSRRHPLVSKPYLLQVTRPLSPRDAVAELTNEGFLNIAAVANANATGMAVASASVAQAILQSANAHGGNASAIINNAGTIVVAASAHAAGATVAGILIHKQIVTTGAGTSVVTLSSGVVTGAYAFVSGIAQVAHAIPAAVGSVGSASFAGEAMVGLANHGTISILANATGSATKGRDWAAASIAEGIRQTASGVEAFVDLVNEGHIDIAAVAAVGGTAAFGERTCDGYRTERGSPFQLRH